MRDWERMRNFIILKECADLRVKSTYGAYMTIYVNKHTHHALGFLTRKLFVFMLCYPYEIFIKYQ